MDDKVDYDQIVTEILPELFHSSYMLDQSEQYRKCPVCEQNESFDHQDLAEHIINEHPEKLTEYADSISEMLNNPLNYFVCESLYEDPACSICGKRPVTKLELNEHMLSHKQYFKDIVKWLRERAKKV